MALVAHWGAPGEATGQSPVRAPLPEPYHHLAWGLGGPGLVRYNRAEGTYAALGARRVVDHLALDGLLGFASTDPTPQLTLGFTLTRGLGPEVRGELFHRMQAVDPTTVPFGIGNSLSALLAGRDDGEYYRATGAALELSASRVARDSWTIRLYFERQAPPKSAASWSAIGWPRVGFRIRPPSPVERLRQVGVEGALDRGWGDDRGRPSGGLRLHGRAETGGARLLIGAVAGRGRAPLPLGFTGSLRGGLQVSAGDVPSQRLALLGGPSRVRGLGGARRTGEDAVWARLELVRRVPRATGFGFFDWGWAGRRADTAASEPIAAAGVGLSFLDDTLRSHLAWPLDGAGKAQLAIYVNALRVQR